MTDLVALAVGAGELVLAWDYHSLEMRRRMEVQMHRKIGNTISAWLLAAIASVIILRTAHAADGLIGVAPRGQNALEFTGRSDQAGASVIHYGYFTHIHGLPDDSLFPGRALRTEATARFTYFATTTLNARHELENLITTAAHGTLTLYYRATPGASFSAPRSFAQGIPIATFSIRYHNVLNVQAPNSGIATAVADLTQTAGPLFSFNGGRRYLGVRGLRLRLEATGQGRRTQEEPLKATFVLGGHIGVVGP